MSLTRKPKNLFKTQAVRYDLMRFFLSCLISQAIEFKEVVGLKFSSGGPLKMLKMKIDPTMYMKRKQKRGGENGHRFAPLFERKCTRFARMDSNRQGFLNENTQIAR
jgi:hypothetical protein